MQLLQSKKNDFTKSATRKRFLKPLDAKKTRPLLAQSTGRYGEFLAKMFLTKKGYTCLQENYFIRGGEIDLILKKNDILIFVEVKTRHGKYFGEGHEAVNRSKKKKLIRTILHYLEQHRKPFGQSWQLDIIDIHLQTEINQATIKHYQNILLQ